MAIEKLFGQIKRRFPLLSNGLRFREIIDSAKCILACFVLHNICVRNNDNFEPNPQIEEEDTSYEDGDQDESELGKVKRDGIKNYLRRFL